MKNLIKLLFWFLCVTALSADCHHRLWDKVTIKSGRYQGLTGHIMFIQGDTHYLQVIDGVEVQESELPEGEHNKTNTQKILEDMK